MSSVSKDGTSLKKWYHATENSHDYHVYIRYAELSDTIGDTTGEKHFVHVAVPEVSKWWCSVYTPNTTTSKREYSDVHRIRSPDTSPEPEKWADSIVHDVPYVCPPGCASESSSDARSMANFPDRVEALAANTELANRSKKGGLPSVVKSPGKKHGKSPQQKQQLEKNILPGVAFNGAPHHTVHADPPIVPIIEDIVGESNIPVVNLIRKPRLIMTTNIKHIVDIFRLRENPVIIVGK